MSIPPLSSRPLPYPLDRALGFVTEVPDDEIPYDSLAAWPAPSEEKINVIIQLSLNEYKVIASAVDAGRDIAYADESQNVWWLWSRILKSMTICDDVANCIDTSEAVQQSILNVVNNNSVENFNAAAQQLGLQDLAAGLNTGCDNDAWYGAAVNLVQRFNRINEDLLQEVEVALNVGDFIATVVGSLTFLNEIPVSAIANWYTFIQENIEENYLAQYTLAYEEEVSCDLFCLAVENCMLTPQMITDYFAERLLLSISLETLFVDAITFLIDGAWSGTQIVDFMMLSQMAFRNGLGNFLGEVFYGDLTRALSIGFANPSNDWTIICDPCGVIPNCVRYEFFDGPGEWDVLSGSHVAGVGIENALNPISTSNAYFTTIRLQMAATYIRKIRFSVDFLQGDIFISDNQALRISQTDSDSVVSASRLDFTSGSVGVYEFDINQNMSQIRIRFISARCNCTTPSPRGRSTIRWVEIEYDTPSGMPEGDICIGG